MCDRLLCNRPGYIKDIGLDMWEGRIGGGIPWREWEVDGWAGSWVMRVSFQLMLDEVLENPEWRGEMAVGHGCGGFKRSDGWKGWDGEDLCVGSPARLPGLLLLYGAALVLLLVVGDCCWLGHSCGGWQTEKGREAWFHRFF